jgi:hypothetical protein
MRLEVHESSLLVVHSTCVRHTVTQVVNRTWVLDHTLSSHARIFPPSTIEDLHSFTYPAQRFQQLSIPLKLVLASWRTRYLRSSSTTASRSQR